MGAEYQSVTFTLASKEEIAKMWAKDVEQSLYEHGHCYSGGIGMLGPDIQWRGEKFDSPDKADKFIEDNHQKWEPPMAVAFSGGWVVGGWCSS